MPDSHTHPSTPDGRYFVVAGRLWRMSNPGLAPEQRQELVNRLMDARRQVGLARKASDAEAERSARAAVDEAKRALGERGPVWWTDGAPDFNRRMVANTPYAEWHAALPSSESNGEMKKGTRFLNLAPLIWCAMQDEAARWEVLISLPKRTGGNRGRR